MDAPSSTTTASATIGPAGGTLQVDGALLTIPANALATPTMITLTRTATPAPNGLIGASPVFEIIPKSQAFAVPVQLRITYSTVFAAPPSSVQVHWSLSAECGQNLAVYEHLIPTVSGNDVTGSAARGGCVVAGACPDLCPGGGA